VEALLGAGGERALRMDAVAEGYHALEVEGAPAGTRYAFSLDGGEARPDPCSRRQPEGVHAFSEVVEAAEADPTDGHRNRALHEQALYELHVGTFTESGTFDGVIERLPDLSALGITAISLMPVAEFPGARNWGYDGVSLFAAHHAYGGLEGLVRLRRAAHAHGLSVYLDVVYNHLGPEGNYLREFGPYFTHQYATPWGDALNFDGPHSDHVRRFFIENALHWTRDVGLDGLRLDALHAIVDNSATPFIEDLTRAVHRASAETGRRIHMIGESAANDTRLLRPREESGLGCDAQWNDDFHHAVRAALTGERQGYYASYGGVSHLARSLAQGYVYTGEFSEFHQRRHGRPCADRPASCFVAFVQNHDQVGNRVTGERLDTAVTEETRRLAAALLLLSPFPPMLFMGEEYAETAPFQYFVSHTDPELVEAVQRGRREEFASFGWREEPPDPQDEATFARSRLRWDLRRDGAHAQTLAMHTRLLALRRDLRLGSDETGERRRVECREAEGLLALHRRDTLVPTLAVFNLSTAERVYEAAPAGRRMLRAFDTSDPAWGGGGLETAGALHAESSTTITLPARSGVLYRQEIS
jgi:maltooligosyltrehalose trehalohydrolase